MNTHSPRISIIAALADGNRAIGKDHNLIWRLPEDLKRFKALTMGHPIIMGRTTFESIGRPLPGRANIVVTRNASFSSEGIMIAHSISEALAQAKSLDQNEIFIIGGADTYAQTLPYVDRLYLTIVEGAPQADAFFPDYSSFTLTISDEAGPPSDPHYRFLTLEK